MTEELWDKSMESGARLDAYLEGYKNGVQNNLSLIDKYRLHAQENRDALVEFIEKLKPILTMPYEFRSSVELAMRKEMIWNLIDDTEQKMVMGHNND